MASPRQPPSVSSTSIPVISSDRAVNRQVRRGRGLNPAVIQRGENAAVAILAAQAETKRYQDELGRVRALLGAQEDRVREFNAILLAKGTAAAGSSFVLPPNAVTAELLQRDQHVFRWSAAYRTENERANSADTRLRSERAEFGRQIADYKLKLAQRDDAVSRSELAPAAALNRALDRCTDLQRKLEDCETDMQRKLDECEADLTQARASAKFHKKQHREATLYYNHKLAQQSAATIAALSAEVHHRDRADAAYTTIDRLEKALASAHITRLDPRDAATSPASPTHVPTPPAPPSPQDGNRTYTWADGYGDNYVQTPDSPSTSPPRTRRRSSSGTPRSRPSVSPFHSRP
jgi:hypothetical protein